MIGKQTRQRSAIRGVLKTEGRPLTAEEIYRLARRDIPRLGLATVYRSIRRMVEERQLIGVDFPGHPTRYELPSLGQHAHFICSICGRVFDLPDAPHATAIRLPEGFSREGCELVVYGSCPDCGDPDDEA
jgi:Fur family transcriptional regulator, ferric uptake regulator